MIAKVITLTEKTGIQEAGLCLKVLYFQGRDIIYKKTVR